MLPALRVPSAFSLASLLAFGALAMPSPAHAQGAGTQACVPGGAGPSGGPLAGLVQPAGAPDELLALVEIPAGSAAKYELHAPSGRMQVDRFLATPVAYPVNYGILPCTLAGDGDQLDVLVLTRFPVAPGALVRVRPVGVLRMIDGGDDDPKLLAVPVDAVDATWSGVREPTDLPAAEIARIETFFRLYKTLPAPAARVEVGPWEGPEAARTLVMEALAAAGAH
jgi:inorganic pyrophosphatase